MGADEPQTRNQQGGGRNLSPQKTDIHILKFTLLSFKHKHPAAGKKPSFERKDVRKSRDRSKS